MRRGQDNLRSDVNERLNEFARGQDNLRADMKSLRSEISSLRNNMLLLIGGAWVTTVGGFIALFMRG